ncbi:MAG: hydrogenase maturation nickel metallochaperone HypA [Methylomonas sp.]
MHEMSLCEGILGVLQEQSRTQNFQRVRTVFLEIGVLAGVEVDAMRFSFDVVMQGTLADRARLEISLVPGSAWCLGCGQQVEVSQLYDECPLCGSYQLQVDGGQQMRIKELEVE